MWITHAGGKFRHALPESHWHNLTFLSRRFREGISFPNFVERSILKLPPSPRSVLRPSLHRTEQFSRGREGRKGAEKRAGQGVATKGGKQEERTRENQSVAPLSRFLREELGRSPKVEKALAASGAFCFHGLRRVFTVFKGRKR